MGTTIIRGAAIVEPELDSTTFWHTQVGHMGECGMIELHKRKLLKGIKTCKLELCKFAFLGNKTWYSSRQPHTRQRGFLIMFTQTFGD